MIKFLIYYLKNINNFKKLNYLYFLNNIDVQIYVFLNYKIFYFKNFWKFKFYSLMDLFCLDFPFNKSRFNLRYVLLSVFLSLRITLQVFLSIFNLMKSINKYYLSANWFEREIWDLFGIYFYYHPDLRRILNDYGFLGHPMRKEFPLTGFIEIRYDDSKKNVVVDNLELSQEFRLFSFLSPWH